MPIFWVISFIYLSYLSALIWPGPLWGFHAVWMLPPAISIAFLIVIIAFTLDVFFPWIEQIFNFFGTLKVPNYLPVLLITIACGLLFYLFPIHVDIYGDSERFKRLMGVKTSALLPYHLDNLFSFNIFHPKNGERTWLNLIQVLSYYFEWTHVSIFKGLNLVSGVLFVLTWSTYIFNKLGNSSQRILGLLVVLSSFCMQNFFGHLEIYGPSLVLLSWFMICWLQQMQKPSQRTLIGLFFLLFLCIKSHTLFFLLVPLFLISLGIHFGRIQSLNWKWLFTRIILPFAIVGGVLYFLVFKDFNDPMTLTSDTQFIDRLFLPLSGGVPPQDKYHLFSINHLLDFLNIVISWSPVIWMVVLSIWFSIDKHILKKDPILIVLTTTIFLFGSFYFMINPLLSMARDWDLFGLITPLLIMITIYLMTIKSVANRLIGPVIGLSVFAMSIHIVNAHPQSLGRHYETMGAHIHKSYWATGSGIIVLGIKLQRFDLSTFEQKLIKQVEALESYSNPGDDIEYANLLKEVAKVNRTQIKDLTKALEYHQSAFSYAPQLDDNVLGLVETHFLLEQYDEAFAFSKQLLDLHYPNDQQANMIAIQCALEAGKYQEAQSISSQYLEDKPDDTFIQEINKRLVNAENIDSLRFLFTRSPNAQ